MFNAEHGKFADGTSYTISNCTEEQYRNKKRFSFGGLMNGVTVIVDRSYVASEEIIQKRGSNKKAWKMIAIAILGKS
ncbi:MAG: hypothetical protein ABI758_01510 [Candidatus Woesebacteria bacterium]